MASSKAEAVYLLKRGVVLRVSFYKVDASVGIKEVWKTMTTVFDKDTGPDLYNENCLSRAWERRVFTKKATSLQSAAKTQLEVKRAILLEV